MSHRWLSTLALVLLLLPTLSAVAYAQPAKRSPTAGKGAEKMLSLDEQVQAVKSDVLRIAAELSNLEEKLLYPSGTQLALFVSAVEAEELDVDSVEVELDGALVGAHVYTHRELQALGRGGVQRLYTGNVAVGEHRVALVIRGHFGSGSPSTKRQEFTFLKGIEPRLVEIRLSDRGADAQLVDVELD